MVNQMKRGTKLNANSITYYITQDNYIEIQDNYIEIQDNYIEIQEIQDPDMRYVSRYGIEHDFETIRYVFFQDIFLSNFFFSTVW